MHYLQKKKCEQLIHEEIKYCLCSDCSCNKNCFMNEKEYNKNFMCCLSKCCLKKEHENFIRCSYKNCECKCVCECICEKNKNSHSHYLFVSVMQKYAPLFLRDAWEPENAATGLAARLRRSCWCECQIRPPRPPRGDRQ